MFTEFSERITIFFNLIEIISRLWVDIFQLNFQQVTIEEFEKHNAFTNQRRFTADLYINYQ